MKILIEKLEEQNNDHDKFIGLRKYNDKYIFTAPYGYYFDKQEIYSNNTTDTYKIRKILRAITKASKSNYVKYRIEEEKSKGSNISAGIYIINDYLENGLYNEYDKEYKKCNSGNINFKKTISTQTPIISNNNIFYHNYITDYKKINDKTLINQSQSTIINHFMSNGGNLIFGMDIKIPGEKLILNKNLKNRLVKLRDESFNSRKIQLINNMIRYIEYCDNNFNRGNTNNSFMLVGSTLWQAMLNECYSNDTNNDSTKYGNQYVRYNITQKNKYLGHKTKHDTIYEDDKKIFIIDAKHYKNEDKLLSESVVSKQFGYFYSAQMKSPGKNVYNIFIIPNINNGSVGFRDYIIHRPNMKSLNEFIFVYCIEYEKILDSYLNEKKLIKELVDDFNNFFSNCKVREYIKNINMENKFEFNCSYFELL